MDCLLNYIGIRGCGEEAPASNQYINTLPGISLESLDKIADSEQITYKGVWEDVQAEASTRFYTDFIEELNKCYALQPYCDYEQMICDNKARLINAWKYLLGNQIMVFRLYTPRLNRFTTVDIEDAAKLMDYYQVEYEKSLKQAMKLIDTSSCCMPCSGNPEYVTWLP